MAQPFALRSTILDEPAPEAFRADLAIKLTCPNCNALEVNLIEEFGSGDLVCGDCGTFGPAPSFVSRLLISFLVFVCARRSSSRRQDRRHEVRM